MLTFLRQARQGPDQTQDWQLWTGREEKWKWHPAMPCHSFHEEPPCCQPNKIFSAVVESLCSLRKNGHQRWSGSLAGERGADAPSYITTYICVRCHPNVFQIPGRHTASKACLRGNWGIMQFFCLRKWKKKCSDSTWSLNLKNYNFLVLIEKIIFINSTQHGVCARSMWCCPAEIFCPLINIFPFWHSSPPLVTTKNSSVAECLRFHM